MKTALVFGGYGQAGRFLVPLLESKGYKVIAPTHAQVDITEISMLQCIMSVNPDELYNLAATMPFNNWEDSIQSMLVNTVAVRRMMHTLFASNSKAKFFQAGSASVFGNALAPQNENSIKSPTTTYGVSKLAAQELVRVYREHGYFACTGIFFNMESQFRYRDSFTRKVTLGIATIISQINKGIDPQPLRFGDLCAVRDWGLAKEYMEAAYLMMQSDQPDDYVIGTGIAASCLDFVKYAFKYASVDDSLFTYKLNVSSAPYPLGIMQASPQKILNCLGWKAKTSYKGVIDNLFKAVLDKDYGKSLIAR